MTFQKSWLVYVDFPKPAAHAITAPVDMTRKRMRERTINPRWRGTSSEEYTPYDLRPNTTVLSHTMSHSTNAQIDRNNNRSTPEVCLDTAFGTWMK